MRHGGWSSLQSPRRNFVGWIRRCAAVCSPLWTGSRWGDPALDVKRLKGGAESRLRVGDWRVRFRRDEAARLILVAHVLPRGRAYDR